MSQQARDIFTDSIAAAAAAITQFRCVGFDNLQASVQGQKVKGVAKRSTAIGQPVEIALMGTAIAEAGGAIAVGATLICDAQGRVITGSGALKIAAGAVAVTSAAANGTVDITGGDSPEWCVGDALAAAGGAGELIEILLRR